MKSMKKILCIVAASALCLGLFTGCGSDKKNSDKKDANGTQATQQDSEKTVENLTGKHHVEIEVANYGTIAVELDADVAPITVTNFVNLANQGFYDGLTFMRVMNGFMIQGGDPNKDCTGGSDQTIKGEFSSNGVENNISHVRGTISMARSSAPDSASSQFFIVQADSTYLDGQYAGFGTVTAGMEIVDKICTDATEVDGNGLIADVAKQPVITTIKVID